MKLHFCIAAIALLAGCADAPPAAPQQVTAANAGAAMVCQRVTPTGSNMPVSRCEPVTSDANRMDAKDATARITAPLPATTGASGR